ncbi:MAG: oligopeptide ABC transporter permease OppB [Paracoccus sp. (in: a-proteobacteria)]|jgi:oligopeptide transport system permease protein|uniref:oligopeptide ABC transporter permease OppB n=1 Tax=unclassified Paracoccus (in: a-proteobacteria) TaxID=2688777 RepID=UPI000C4132D1|nr:MULTISPECIES: oligopeptide ABC transporter permease OppB [unclassified Paracoccus (in: a-proteobacteria)]MAN57526.1 oligopeptide ABC transporter permease OppB [Paracoccus sp. (in: a-proteobacteria)]MBA50055.1 oligopeptide ABC transporter permease OppB [Paracoccus sp. (in: a-proteobacteria)]MCS5603623.1 oligopeptide ABC transporter permease OppB [Paracoccus sp. (in: a-proteobacteria)]MDB2551239.1 oligopeptide ABC transporter permease OppB [Paracoccus sp. (in: a-proteobacteria)]HIC67761.1 oli|tara:strand:+ start:2963 stop:3886 length:924 start_codon:yes stop_codon:yes gene_type:complete
MFAYIMRRLAVAIPTLLLLIVFSFVLMHMAPGGPFTQERALPPQVIANLNAKYGLDQPLWRQIASYLWGIVANFDFGPSFVYPDRTVNQLIAAGFPVTLTYGTLSFIAAVVVGVGLGVVAAIWHNGFLDYLAVGISIGAQVLPNFVMAPILVLVFTLWYRMLPGGGWSFEDPSYWIMPVIALGTSYMASIARITRSSMLEVLGSNHIRTARAKGMPEHRVILRHALKPALLPVISYLGPVFVSMITGSVVIDVYFSTGGIGKAFVDSALNRDYAVMMGVTILVGALTILFNLVVDILYAWIDPKIRY